MCIFFIIYLYIWYWYDYSYWYEFNIVNVKLLTTGLPGLILTLYWFILIEETNGFGT